MINKVINIDKMITFFWSLLLMFMMIAPKKFLILEMLILILLVMLVSFNEFKINTRSPILKFYIVFMIYACLAYFIGIFKGNPGALSFGRFHIIYISILTYILFGIRKIDGILDNSFKIAILSTAIISIYNLFYILVGFGLWPESFMINLEFNPIMVWHHSGYMQYYTTNSTMLTFLTPFCFGLNFENNYHGKKKYITIFISSFSAIILFLTGRRAFWLSLIITFVYYLFFYRGAKAIKSRMFIGVFLIMLYGLIQIFEIYDVNGIVERFTSVYDFLGDYGTSVRMIQIKELFKGFLEQPIFGSGAGIGVDYTRNANGYSYEASYSLILYNSGIIGSLFYLLSMLVIIFPLYKLTLKRTPYSNSLLIGFVSILITNGTNPYLNSTFAFLWVFFLPLLYLDEMRRKLQICRMQQKLRQ